MWSVIAQVLFNLWIGWSLWRFHRRAEKAEAAVWHAVAELRMDHNSLAAATEETFRDVGEVVADLSGERVAVTVAPPQACNCQNCRKRRQLAVN